MSQAMERAADSSSGVRQYLLALYYLAVGNMSISAVVAGFVVIAVGAIVLTGIHDVFAGMFGIWGASLALLGLLSYAVLKANALYARLSE